MLRKPLYEQEITEKLSVMPEQTQAKWIIKEVNSDNLLPTFRMFLNISGKRYSVKSAAWNNNQDTMKVFPVDVVRERMQRIRESCPHVNYSLEIKAIDPKEKEYLTDLCNQKHERNTNKKPSR